MIRRTLLPRCPQEKSSGSFVFSDAEVLICPRIVSGRPMRHRDGDSADCKSLQRGSTPRPDGLRCYNSISSVVQELDRTELQLSPASNPHRSRRRCTPDRILLDKVGPVDPKI